MFRLPEFRRLFRLVGLRRPATAVDVDAELAFHLEMRVAELVARGLPEAEARALALERFGDLALAARDLRDTDAALHRRRRLSIFFDDLRRDLGFSLRGFRREPGFAVVALAVLGLGVGLTTAMVSITDRMVLRPLSYPASDRLGVAWLAVTSGEHGMQIYPTATLWNAWRSIPLLERVEAYRAGRHLIEERDRPPTLIGTREVTPGLLPGLGAEIALGRGLLAEDTVRSSPMVGLLSWRWWQSHFGGDPAVLGTSIRINGDPVTVVGVLRAGFDLTALDRETRTDVWLPLRTRGDEKGGAAPVLIGWKPGVTRTEAQAAIGQVFDRLPEADRPWTDFRPIIQDANDLVGKDLRQTLTLLTGATGLVLVVAVANIAALMLGRALRRLQEFGVRAALGAGRSRVARQLATESILLGLGGGLVGLVLSRMALLAARALRPESLRRIDDISMSWVALAVAVVVSLGAALAFGLAPIWAVSRSDAALALVGRSRRAVDGRGPDRLRSLLVIAQLAISVTLVVGAGLLIQSFARSQQLPFGFEPRGLGQVSFDFPEKQFPDKPRRQALRLQVVERARGVLGVRDLAVSQNSALEMGVMRGEFLPEGREWPATETSVFMPMLSVTPEFFRVSGMPLLAGRPMSSDTAARDLVIDESAARRYWPQGAIGKRVKLGRQGSWRTVVGVVTDNRVVSDNFADTPVLYVMETIDEGAGGVLNVRFDRPAVLNGVVAAVRAVDPDIRIHNFSTAEAALVAEFASRRFSMVLAISFAVLTLVLASVGLYGTLTLQVTQRRFEIGVRLAIGAAPEGVRWMVLRAGMIRVLAGLAVGSIGVLALGKVIAALLYHSTPWDTLVFSVAAGAVVVVGIAATWLPARRASRVDPLLALRTD